MSNATVAHLGQVNGAGPLTALERDIIAGKTIDAFFRNTVTEGKFDVQTVVGGNAATFYATGRVKARAHTAGAEILGGGNYKKNKVTVLADNVILADEFIDINEWLRSSIDDKMKIAAAIGKELARAFDVQQLRSAILAARTAALVSGESGGTVVEVANLSTDVDVYIAAVAAAREQLVMKGVDFSSFNLYVPPSIYTQLNESTKLLDKNWVKTDNGDYARSIIKVVKDFPVIETPNFPTGYALADDASVTAIGEDPDVVLARYRGVYTNTHGLIAGSSAIATARVIAPTTEVDRDPRRLGWLMKGYMACGTGVQDARQAVELVEDVTP